jgi:uncharacterized protein (AIM24 family)
MKTLTEQFQTQSFGIIPTVSFNLQPGSSVIAHPNTMPIKSPDLNMTVRMLSNRERKRNILTRMWRRMTKGFVGQFITAQYNNESNRAQFVSLHPEHGGNIVWIDLNKYGNIVFEKGKFMAATNPDLHLGVKGINATAWQFMFADQEKLLAHAVSDRSHSENHIFLTSRAAAVQIDMKPGQRYDVESNSLLAATDNVQISLRKVPGFLSRQFGNASNRYTVVEGPGTIWLETSNAAAANQHGVPSLGDFVQNLTPGA